MVLGSVGRGVGIVGKDELKDSLKARIIMVAGE